MCTYFGNAPVAVALAQHDADHTLAAFDIAYEFHAGAGFNLCPVIGSEFRKPRTASVTDLNTARTESDNATQKYVRDIASFWNYYYTLRKLTLYDFLAGDDLEVDYEEMTQ